MTRVLVVDDQELVRGGFRLSGMASTWSARLATGSKRCSWQACIIRTSS